MRAKLKIPKAYRREELELIYGINLIRSQFHSIGLHQHDFYEFECFLSGAGHHTLNGVTSEVHAGDVVFVTPLDFHSYESATAEGFTVINIRLSAAGVLNCGISDFEGLAACAIRGNAQLSHLFQELYSRFRQHAEVSAIKPILKHIAEDFFEKAELRLQTKTGTGLFHTAIGFIYTNFLSPISVGDVCAVCGYSPVYFGRMFKAHMGIEVGQYINSVRIRYALNLIRSQKISLIDASFQSGFNSYRTFQREFERIYGCYPNKYRHKCQ